MKPFVRETLERQRLRLHELDALLSAPDAVADMERFRKLTREHADTDTVVQPYLRYLQREADLREAEAMCKDSDADMAAMAQDEAAQPGRPGRAGHRTADPAAASPTDP